MTTYDRPFGRYFEDFQEGDVYQHWPGKTITEYDDHLFCMITMNHHPLHTNAWFAEHETVHGRNVVVGNLVYSVVLGMSVPDVSGSCIANLEVEELTHQRPTFHGDTIYAETRVLGKRESTDQAGSGRGHGRDQGLQPAGRGGLLLPPAGDGLEARRRPGPPAALRRRHLGLTAGVRSVLAPVECVAPTRAAAPLHGVQAAVLAWGEKARRDLPWRRTRDPVGDPGQRGHAGPDPGRPGHPQVGSVPGPLARPGTRARRRRSGR